MLQRNIATSESKICLSSKNKKYGFGSSPYEHNNSYNVVTLLRYLFRLTVNVLAQQKCSRSSLMGWAFIICLTQTGVIISVHGGFHHKTSILT